MPGSRRNKPPKGGARKVERAQMFAFFFFLPSKVHYVSLFGRAFFVELWCFVGRFWSAGSEKTAQKRTK